MANQIQPPNQIQHQEISQHIREEIHSGPIPTPETLDGYKKTDPSFPERIVKMAEAHNDADVRTKNRISLSNLILPIIGQLLTFFLAGGGIVACIYLARAGYTIPSIAAVTSTFLPIIIGTIRNLRRKD